MRTAHLNIVLHPCIHICTHRLAHILLTHKHATATFLTRGGLHEADPIAGHERVYDTRDRPKNLPFSKADKKEIIETNTIFFLIKSFTQADQVCCLFVTQIHKLHTHTLAHAQAHPSRV